MDASLEFRDVTVTIATPSDIDSEHNALCGFKDNGPPKGDEDAVCWVAVPHSLQFCIHVAYNGVSPPVPNAGLSCRVEIDGTGVLCNAFITPESILKAVAQRINHEPVLDGEVEITGLVSDDDNTRIHHLCFLERLTTDSGENISPPNSDEFGIVEVVVSWSRELDHMAEASDFEESCDLELLTKPVHERQKDIQYRYIGGVGPAEYDPSHDAWSVYDTMPVQDEDGYVFQFKYRDLGWLQTKGIAPRS
ncbi:hypothetical protein FRC12_012186 [Ceratobasidium sp. 428]|nr:hypothetical protein FRC12_012186 [Ceratobasidium sp. 428]